MAAGAYNTGDAAFDADFARGAGGGEAPDIDQRGAAGETLAEHLHAQIGAVADDAQDLAIARWLIDQLDEAGYLDLSLRDVADVGVQIAAGRRATERVEHD